MQAVKGFVGKTQYKLYKNCNMYFETELFKC